MIITTISRPTLTPEERAKRMEEIKESAVRLVLATQRANLKKIHNNRRTTA